MMVIDGKEQDPGDVFRALAGAFKALPAEAQSAAIDAANAALNNLIEAELDKAGVEPANAHEHEAAKALMLVANMARAMFASRGRVIVLRRPEAALIVTQLTASTPHVDIELHASAEGAGPEADRLIQLMAAHTPAANRPGGS
jgi:hypothetical protein